MPFYKHLRILSTHLPPVEIWTHAGDFEHAKALCRWVNAKLPESTKPARFLNPPWEPGDRAMTINLLLPDQAPLALAVGNSVAYEDGGFYILTPEELAMRFVPVADPT